MTDSGLLDGRLNLRHHIRRDRRHIVRFLCVICNIRHERLLCVRCCLERASHSDVGALEIETQSESPP
jgi:hypothetical protein